MAELLPIKVVSTLDQAQITQAKQNAAAIAAVGLTTPSSTTDRFTFFAAFDGTRNNRDDLTRFRDIQNTNVAQLETQVNEATAGNLSFKSKYYAGIGSDGSLIAAGPLPTAQAISIAEQAYRDFNASASDWVKNNPGKPVQIMMATDSRGDAVGAFYAQMVYARGVTDPVTHEVLILPSQVRIAGLVAFEPVTTFINGSTRYPPIVDNAVVIRADNEMRSEFHALNRTDEPNFTTITMPGNHGNVIGFYDNSIGALTLGGENGLGAATGYFINRQLPIGAVDAARLYDANQPANVYTEGVRPARDLAGNLIYVPNFNEDVGTRQTQSAGGSVPTTQYNPDGSVQSNFTDYLGRQIISLSKTNADNSTTVDVSINGGEPLQVISQTQLYTSADRNTQILSVYSGSGFWQDTTTVRTPFTDGTFTLVKTYPNGRIVSSAVGDDGKLASQDVTIPLTNGSTQTQRFNGTGVLQYTTNTAIDNEGSKLVTTRYPDGRIDAQTYNSDQTLYSRDITTPTPWGTSLVRTNGAGERVLGITRQTDDDGNVLEITTNADNTGTGRAIAPNGNTINQSSFTLDGGTGSVSGTVTEQINGKAVVFNADFATDTDGAPSITPRGIASIGGITLASSGLVTAEDLKAFGFDFKGAPRPTVEALIAALDPATQQTNNWTVPDLTVTNLPGNLVQRSLELGNGVTLSSIRTQAGQLVTTTEVTRGADGSFMTVVKDADGKLLTNTSTEYIYDQTNVSRIETVTNPSGVSVRNVFDDEGNLASSNPITTGGTNIGQTIGTAIDFLSLIRAIQIGQPLPLLASGLRLANTLSNGANLELSGASNAASGILSLLSLNAALERGDTLGIVTAGTQTIAFGAQSLSDFAASQAFNAIDAGGFDEAAVALSLESGALAQTLGEALPYLNLVNGIINGDPVGIATGVLMLIPGGQPFAIALTVANLIFSLWDDEGTPYVPPPYGTGRFAWSSPGADTSLRFETAGERGGDQAVSNVMTQVLATLNAVIERQRQQNPGSALGIIANRMPGVSYDGTGYSYTDINPLTGEQKNPELRFDTSGRPYNATPGSPESFQSITEGIVRSALARGAIAPMWEVQTAKLQNDAGDPKAGLSEEERAGRDGQLASASTNAGNTPTTQKFRPVTLDLDGDGLETSTRAAGVAFDVDDSGYLKQSTHYKKRSCLRTYSLGYSTKTHPKTAHKCEKRASGRATNTKVARKQVFFVVKSSQSRLFMCASSYAIYSVTEMNPRKSVAL